MSQETIISNTEVSFKDFLFKNKRNRTILWIAAAAIVIQFSVFKYFYPFASYIHGDSFSYINAAYHNLSINTYLIGYSNLLRLVSVFTKSDFILTAFQYILIQCSVLFLLFSIFYFNKTSKSAQAILLTFMIFNPLFLHLGNLISSDGFFLAVSMTWISLLLWILSRPSKQLIIWHAIVLLLSFITRYNAMLYPIISVGVIWCSKLSNRQKYFGIGAGLILCGLFVGFTSYKYKKLTGYWQYSPFSGWQLTNNAMFAYRYVNPMNRKPVPEKFQILDNMVRQYFDSTRDTDKFPMEKIQASTFYMWSPKLTMFKYRDSTFSKDPTASELKKWASMGPIFKDYGVNIIQKYPWHFIRYFIWPNANKYYAPPIEFLESYNSNKKTVTIQAKEWFGYKSQNVYTRMKDNMVWVLNFYPILAGIINVIMLLVLICYISLKGWRTCTTSKKLIILGSTVWILNAGFTILASSAALRFQSFPILLTAIIATLLLDWLYKIASIGKIENFMIETEIQQTKVPEVNF